MGVNNMTRLGILLVGILISSHFAHAVDVSPGISQTESTVYLRITEVARVIAQESDSAVILAPDVDESIMLKLPASVSREDLAENVSEALKLFDHYLVELPGVIVLSASPRARDDIITHLWRNEIATDQLAVDSEYHDDPLNVVVEDWPLEEFVDRFRIVVGKDVDFQTNGDERITVFGPENIAVLKFFDMALTVFAVHGRYLIQDGAGLKIRRTP